MSNTYGEVNAAAGPEFTRFVVGVHDPVALQNENAFFVSVVVDRGFARRNPSRELSDLFAAEVGIDQVTEQTVLAGANVFAKILMHQQSRRLAGLRRRRIVDDVTPRVFRTTGAHQAECLCAGVLDAVDRARRNENRSSRAERVFESVNAAFPNARRDVEHLFGHWIHHSRRHSGGVIAYGLSDALGAAVLGDDHSGRPVAASGKLPVFGGIHPATGAKNFHDRTIMIDPS